MKYTGLAMINLRKVILEIRAAFLCVAEAQHDATTHVPYFQGGVALCDDIELSEGSVALALKVVAPLVLSIITFILWRLAVGQHRPVR